MVFTSAIAGREYRPLVSPGWPHFVTTCVYPTTRDPFFGPSAGTGLIDDIQIQMRLLNRREA